MSLAYVLQVDGVLCDGPSPENIASTVVDCTKIESGQIGFFRVGLIPKSKVTTQHSNTDVLLFTNVFSCLKLTANLFCCDFQKVLQIFEEIQKKHMQGEMNAAFETDTSDPNRYLTVSQTNLSVTQTDSGLGRTTPTGSQSSLDLSQHGNQEEEDDALQTLPNTARAIHFYVYSTDFQCVNSK